VYRRADENDVYAKMGEWSRAVVVPEPLVPVRYVPFALLGTISWLGASRVSP